MHINHHNTSFYISLKVIDGGFLAAMYSKTLLVTIRYRYWHIFKYIYRPYIAREMVWLWSTFNIHTTLHICPSLSHCTKTFLCDTKNFLSTWVLLVSIFDIQILCTEKEFEAISNLKIRHVQALDSFYNDRALAKL